MSPAVAAALRRYRVMAYVVGVLLVVLVLVGVPLKYLAHEPTVAKVVGVAHGFLFMVYLLACLDLVRRYRWLSLVRTAVLLVSGTVPFLSFVVERQTTRLVRTGT